MGFIASLKVALIAALSVTLGARSAGFASVIVGPVVLGPAPVVKLQA